MFRLQLLLFALVLGLMQLLFSGVGIGRRDGIICCMCCRSKNRSRNQNSRLRNHCFFHNILSHVSCYESYSGWHNEPGMTLGISLKNVFDLQPWQKMLPLRTLSALA